MSLPDLVRLRYISHSVRKSYSFYYNSCISVVTMLSGSIIMKPRSINEQQLDKLVWQRVQDDLDLKSVFQFGEESYRVDTKYTGRSALVIHQYVGIQEGLIQLEDGRFDIANNRTVMTKWSTVIVAPSYIIVDTKNNRPFVKDVINKGLKLSPNTAHYLALDTPKMAEDHDDQWVRCFSERDGRVDRGTLYGRGVEQDIVFGQELSSSRTMAVGLTTKFFGRQSKVRISGDGIVSVLDFITPEQFMQFIESEILPYRIALPD
jgi:hypothetical protein